MPSTGSATDAVFGGSGSDNYVIDEGDEVHEVENQSYPE